MAGSGSRPFTKLQSGCRPRPGVTRRLDGGWTVPKLARSRGVGRRPQVLTPWTLPRAHPPGASRPRGRRGGCGASVTLPRTSHLLISGECQCCTGQPQPGWETAPQAWAQGEVHRDGLGASAGAQAPCAAPCCSDNTDGARVPPSSKAQSLWIITWGNPLSPSSPHLKKRKVKGRSLT